MPNIKHCTICDELGHTAFYCFYRTQNGFKPTSGKFGRKWLKIRAKWFKLNPPDHAGYYYCFYCGVALTKEEVELDHKISRSRDPSLRYELSNIVPSCHRDNMAKGSLSADEYKKVLDTP